MGSKFSGDCHGRNGREGEERAKPPVESMRSFLVMMSLHIFCDGAQKDDGAGEPAPSRTSAQS